MNNNIDIKFNTTLGRKSTYIPSLLRNIDDGNMNDTIEEKIKSDIHFDQESLGIYLRLKEFKFSKELKDIYIDPSKSIKLFTKSIQIDSLDRNIQLFQNPLNFITYIGHNNSSIENGTIIQIEPRIHNNIPNISTIKLRKMIIPKFTNIIKYQILDSDINYQMLLNIGNDLLKKDIQLNSSFLIDNNIVTIVNYKYVDNKYEKINFIINYLKLDVYSVIYNTSETIINSIYKYNVDTGFDSKKQKIFNLIVKELDDNYDYSTSNVISTYRLYPKTIKKNYLYADSKNIEKIFDKVPVKLNKLSISLNDSNNNQLNINNLDLDVINKCNSCICKYEEYNYACHCSYILHPLNPLYQIYLFFSFRYLDIKLNKKYALN